MLRWLALGVLALALLLIAVDATVLALALPALQKDLAPSAAEVLWIGDVYSFVLGGLLVTMGTLGDRIGRKKLLLTGAFGFGAASVLAAFAPKAVAVGPAWRRRVRPWGRWWAVCCWSTRCSMWTCSASPRSPAR